MEASFDNHAAGNVLLGLGADVEVAEVVKRKISIASGAADAAAALWGRSRVSREAAVEVTM